MSELRPRKKQEADPDFVGGLLLTASIMLALSVVAGIISFVGDVVKYGWPA